MIVEREPEALTPLPDELEQAVSGLRAFVEPTPRQLDLSYQRVQQALAALPAPALAPVALAPAMLPRSAAAGAERALRARGALWAVSGGVTAVALVAGFAIGRWTLEAPPSAAGSAATVLAAPVVLGLSELPPILQQNEEGALVPQNVVPQNVVPQNAVPAEAAAPEAMPVEAAPVKALAPEQGEPMARRPPKRAASASSAEAAAGASEQLCPARDPLLRAECLLRRRQPQQALAALRAVSTKPAGAAQERERERVLGLTLLARCQLGQEVRSLGERFFAQWPASPLTWRIRNECPSAEPGADSSPQRAAVSPALTP